MTPPPRIRGTSVSISTPAPPELAAFYARLLGVEVSVSEGPRAGEPPGAGWAQIKPVEDHLNMTLNFEWDEHYVPPVWPTPVPSRLGWPSVPSDSAHIDSAHIDSAHIDSVHNGSVRSGSVHSDSPAAPVTAVPVPTTHVVVTPGHGPQQAMAHLDLWVDDLHEASAWAIECGATQHPHQPQQNVRVMLDPHGHPFCLFTG